MKKQIKILLVFLFFMVVMNLVENNFVATARADGDFSVVETEPINLNTSTLYLPEDFGMNSVKLAHIDTIVINGIKAMAFPGCQVLVLKDGKPIYDKCFGNYTYEEEQKVQPTTIYDLASLSKTTGTLLAVMKLYDNGKLKLTDKASKYLTYLRGTDKENITITQLLFHESGLPSSLPFYQLVIEKKNVPPLSVSAQDFTPGILADKKRVVGPSFVFKEDWASKIHSAEYASQVSDSFYVNNRFHQSAMQMIAKTPMKSKTYLYSCVNFIVQIGRAHV